MARRVGDSSVLEGREAIEQRLRARCAHIPEDERLADELVAERREDGP